MEGQGSLSELAQNENAARMSQAVSPSGSRALLGAAGGLRSVYGSQARMQSVTGMSRGNRLSMRNTVKLNMVELKDESDEQNFTNSGDSMTDSVEQPQNS